MATRLRFLLRVVQAVQRTGGSKGFAYDLVPEGSGLAEGGFKANLIPLDSTGKGIVRIESSEPLILFPGKKFWLEEAVPDQEEGN